MRETSLMDNLNCKMQAHARVCEKNKLELEKSDFAVQGASLKDMYWKNGQMYQNDILRDDSP